MSINLSVMPEPSAMLGAAGVATLGAGLVSPRALRNSSSIFLFFSSSSWGGALGCSWGFRGWFSFSSEISAGFALAGEGEGLFFSRWTSASRASTFFSNESRDSCREASPSFFGFFVVSSCPLAPFGCRATQTPNTIHRFIEAVS